MRGRRALVMSLVAIGFLSIAGTALAGSALQIEVAKRADGPYRPFLAPIKIEDSAKDLYVRIKNVAGSQQTMRVEERLIGDDPEDFKVRWYRGRKDVTAAMRAGDYQFNLQSGDARRLRAHVKPVVANPGAACIAATVFATPNGDIEAGSFQLNDDNQCG